MRDINDKLKHLTPHTALMSPSILEHDMFWLCTLPEPQVQNTGSDRFL